MGHVTPLLRLARYFSVAQLRETWGRALLVVVGVAVGTTLVAAINIINSSVLTNFRETMVLIAGPADLSVMLGIGEVGFDESAIELVRRDPHVEIVVPLVRGTVTRADDPLEILQLFGVDLVAERDLRRYRVALATDRNEAERALHDLRSVFLTVEYARQHGFSLGETIPLSTPRGVVAFTIRGLLEPEGLARVYGGRLIVTDIAVAQWLMSKEQRIDQLDVVLDSDADTQVVARRLLADLPAGLEVNRPAQHGMRYESVLASFQAMLTGLSTLCFIAGLFIVFNTTMTAAVQRTSAVAQLRILGATAKSIFAVLVLESFVLGLVGSSLGVAAGIPLANLLSGTVTESMGVIFQLRFAVDDLSAEPWEIAAIIVLGIAVAVFASSFAARRMAMLDPLEQSRSAEPSEVGAEKGARLVRWWLGLVGISIVAFLVEDHSKSIAWGNFGSTVWNASVIVIAVPIVAWASPAVSRGLTRLFGAEGQVAAHSLFRAPVRTGITAAAIALIVTIAIILSSLVLSCRESLRSYFEGIFAADLTVSAVATQGGWLETPLPGELAEEILGIEGVRYVESAKALTGQTFRGERIAVLSMTDRMFDTDRVPAGWFYEGSPSIAKDAMTTSESAMVSVSLADRFDVHVGDSIELATPAGLSTLPVVAVVPDYVSDRGTVILHANVFRRLWDDSTVNRFLVFLDDGAKIEAVRSAIQQHLGSVHRLKILDMTQLLDYHTGLINRAFAVMHSIQLLIVIVTVVGIFDLLVSRIIERRRELGVWRVLGADGRMLHRSVVLEAATTGFIGATLGVITGLISAWVWIRFHFRQLLGYYVEFHFAWFSSAWYLVLVMIMTIVAGYAAARVATRRSVLEAIRNE